MKYEMQSVDTTKRYAVELRLVPLEIEVFICGKTGRFNTACSGGFCELSR